MRRLGSLTAAAVAVAGRRTKGDYGFNVFHNSNPQHGGSYARHERRMREDEVEDFLKSVKGWRPFFGTASEGPAGGAEADRAPAPSTLRMGEEAIVRCFTFATYEEAYLFMGRLWAFCYGSDKYPHVTWDDRAITVALYSPSFRGLSKREARVAAFLNDQYNMFRKSRQQQERVLEGVARKARVEEVLGPEAVAAALATRQEQRHAPLPEVTHGVTHWDTLIKKE
ncbi:hypothetical protein STCU_02666 [Strigomonas culicis]|uniref:4a-hydroxytetrahydrobiopterin dehydratase n=1 Tax=Strigomonas culicis TaxID=28005 RepID=S9W039_9TRYP|nr:hypothetical protein STCU_02666 [Strigomonas culicis]|eukprot:EPY32771.1 hypothetical protein STCU_02666 [Strigomonas culicis]